jgi:hypothetical protein
MSHRTALPFLAAYLLLFATISSFAITLPAPGANFTSITTNGIWTWYGEPKAVYYEGKFKRTYMGWLSNTGTIAVGYYDHATGDTVTHVIRTGYQTDDHAHPSIIMRPDGRLIVVCSPHDGAILSVYIATNPEDISSFGAEIKVTGPGFCYPNLMWMSAEGSNGRLYCFIRGEGTLPSYLYSDDWGATWNTPRIYFKNNDNTPKPYCKYAGNGKDEIHMVIERGHRGGSYPAYYMRFKGGVFYNANGTRIGDTFALPIMNTKIDTMNDPAAAGCHGSVWDVAIDGSGRPVVVYDQFKDANNHNYLYLRWTGSSWFKKILLNAGPTMGGEDGFASGVTLDHENTAIVYLSRLVGSVIEIDKWTTRDSGATWDSLAITRGSAKKNCRPCVPRGHKAGTNAGLIWLYGDYTTYNGGAFNMAVKIYPFRELVASHEAVPALRQAPGILSSTGRGILLTIANPQSASLRLFTSDGRLAVDYSQAMKAASPGKRLFPLTGMLRSGGMYIAVYRDGYCRENRTLFVVK